MGRTWVICFFPTLFPETMNANGNDLDYSAFPLVSGKMTILPCIAVSEASRKDVVGVMDFAKLANL